MKTMKSAAFSKYLKHMKMHSELNLSLELLRTNMLSFPPERMVNESQNMIQESYQCTICDRRFPANLGLSQHLRLCQSKNIKVILHWAEFRLYTRRFLSDTDLACQL